MGLAPLSPEVAQKYHHWNSHMSHVTCPCSNTPTHIVGYIIYVGFNPKWNLRMLELPLSLHFTISYMSRYWRIFRTVKSGCGSSWSGQVTRWTCQLRSTNTWVQFHSRLKVENKFKVGKTNLKMEKSVKSGMNQFWSSTSKEIYFSI